MQNDRPVIATLNIPTKSATWGSNDPSPYQIISGLDFSIAKVIALRKHGLIFVEPKVLKEYALIYCAHCETLPLLAISAQQKKRSWMMNAPHTRSAHNYGQNYQKPECPESTKATLQTVRMRFACSFTTYISGRNYVVCLMP